LYTSLHDIEILPWFECKTIFHQHARQKSWHKRSKTSSAKIAANADEKWSFIQTMEEFVSYMIGANISFVSAKKVSHYRRFALAHEWSHH